MKMKTRLPAATDEARQPGQAAPLITPEGLATYLACRRAWWLGDVLGHSPGEQLASAQASLARRQALARRLATAGGALIGLAVLLVALSLLIG